MGSELGSGLGSETESELGSGLGGEEMVPVCPIEVC